MAREKPGGGVDSTPPAEIGLRSDNVCGLDIQQIIEYQYVEINPPPDDKKFTNHTIFSQKIPKYSKQKVKNLES